MDDASFKSCPFCKEKIQKGAVKCRFCGEWLEQPVYQAPTPPISQQSEDTPPPATGAAKPIASAKDLIDAQKAPFLSSTESEEVQPTKLERDPQSETPSEASSEDITLGDKVYRELAEAFGHNPTHEQWKPEFLVRRKSRQPIQPLVLETLWKASEATGTKPLAIKTYLVSQSPIIPLLLILFFVFRFAFPRAIGDGVPNWTYLIASTLAYCTTPGMILVLLLSLYWFINTVRSYHDINKIGATSRTALLPRSHIPSIGIIILILGSFAFYACYTAWEESVAKVKEDLQAMGINLNALKDWDISHNTTNIGDAETGLTPEMKKRMRESLALQFKGQLASTEGVTVTLEGESHDRLIFTVKAAWSHNASQNIIDGLRQGDPDIGNRLRFMDFSELVLAGTNYSESFSQPDFEKWSQDYTAFVSNIISTYGTTGNQSSFFTGTNEISPAMQKLMRTRLADEMNGALKSIYKSFEVKLAGTNDDVLELSCKDASAADMSVLLRQFQEDKTGYFFNALKALGFSEVVFEGGAYRKAIPRSEFLKWCRNYNEYMAQLKKIVGQMSDAMKHSDGAP